MFLSPKTTFPLLILALFLSSIHAHKCSHDNQNFTFKIVEDSHPSKFLKYSASDYQNIRITFDFTNLSNSSTSEQIRDIILPPVKSLLQASIKVIPRTSKILVSSDIIGGDFKVPANSSTEGYDGDLVIFVSSFFDYRMGSYAQSKPYGFDSRTHRPIVGSIRLNTIEMDSKMESAAGRELLISAALHEITHVLGFSSALFPYFINPETLQPLTNHFFNKTVNGVPTMVLNLPSLTNRLRTYFNCSTLEGAYLENQGGPGNIGSHFERRIFYNEYMTASNIQDQRFSEFTLALLEGTGWYQVNYSYAEPMTYGKNQGCAFLDTKCINPTTLEPSFKEFCSPLASRGVSWTRRSFGNCGTSDISDNPNLIPEFDYWGDQTYVNDIFADNCPHVKTGFKEGVDCEDSSQFRFGRRLSYLEEYGFGAKAFLGTLAEDYSPFKFYDGYCFKSKCERRKDGNYNLIVFMGKFHKANCTAAGDLDASVFRNNNITDEKANLVGVLQCPDPNEFCQQVEAEGYCRGNCFGNGACVNKKCKCKDGWTSYNCIEKEEKNNSPRCTKDDLMRTAYGNDCICSQRNFTCQCLLGRIIDKQCPNYRVGNPNDINLGSLTRLWIPVVLVLLLVCVLGWLSTKRKKQTAISQAMLSKENLESTAML